MLVLAYEHFYLWQWGVSSKFNFSLESHRAVTVPALGFDTMTCGMGEGGDCLSMILIYNTVDDIQVPDVFW